MYCTVYGETSAKYRLTEVCILWKEEGVLEIGLQSLAAYSSRVVRGRKSGVDAVCFKINFFTYRSLLIIASVGISWLVILAT